MFIYINKLFILIVSFQSDEILYNKKEYRYKLLRRTFKNHSVKDKFLKIIE
ncbi:hypothetical protein CMALT430_10026 [Carnobacterium maltaromaticum]|nr:hypothetical protein CMALT430_10026 [Carnobacterium maltaromaticum]CAD5901973.1 hypothetical protein CMALT394_40164 [Carnobacterium maltaromaticum]